MNVVNGYPCKNCTDVEYAKKGIDPARPKDGPNGAYAADRAQDTERARDAASAADGPAQRGAAVTFSGALANVTPPQDTEKSQPYRPGATFNISA